MSDEQMLDESFNFSMPLEAQFRIFLNGQIPRLTDPLCLDKGGGGVAFEAIELFALRLRSHGAQFYGPC